ncbi:MAG: fibrobacter succinogenes major paralogous domain-containing protein [Fibrobacter sp.]|nr:fibrobacter succinogenes major paralogous domain-containing protein [Fibrobacter sp.]
MAISKKILAVASASMFAFCLNACGDDSSSSTATDADSANGSAAVTSRLIEGFSQKGPFLKGSTVKLFELDGESLAQTGNVFSGKIQSDGGDFSIKSVSLASPYALLEANGYYRNEISGMKSGGVITLNAITDISDRKNVNVNLLTHLEYDRVLNLVESGMSFAKAKKQAEKEILGAFGIEGDFDHSEDLNIWGSSEGSAALLAFSVLMLGDLSEADFMERLTNFSTDFSSDGKWNDDLTKNYIANWASNIDHTSKLGVIRANIVRWKLGDVPPFEKYIRNFWYKNYGLSDCDDDYEGKVRAVANEKSVLYGTTDRFICKSGIWVRASDLEKDTYKWKAGKDGETKKGDLTDNVYLYDSLSNEWRVATMVEMNLGGCTEAREKNFKKNIGKVGGKWYICIDRIWEKTDETTAYTNGWKSAADGTIKKNDSTGTYYRYDGVAEKWVLASEVEIALGACVEDIQDSIGAYIDSTWHEMNFRVCKNHIWQEANPLDYLNKYWKDGKEIDSPEWEWLNSYIYDEDEKIWRFPMDDVERIAGSCTKSKETDYKKNITLVYGDKYICKDYKWKKAERADIETNGWVATADNEVRKNDSTENFYKYDGAQKAWVVASGVEIDYGVCTEAMEDSIAFYSCSTSAKEPNFICKNKEWVDEWSPIGKFNLKPGTDGEVREDNFSCGQVLKYDSLKATWIFVDGTDVRTGFFACTMKHEGELKFSDNRDEKRGYYCTDSKWIDITAWSWEVPLKGRLNPDIEYGELKDSRDGQVYKTVKIGDQVWMAQNLNYADSVATPALKASSWCYDNDPEKCAVAGRLYTFAAAVDSLNMPKDSESPITGICPDGWHVPSFEEWTTLMENAYCGDLKAKTGWSEWETSSDMYGFSALPGGQRGDRDAAMDEYFYSGRFATFWTSTTDGKNAYNVLMDINCDITEYGVNDLGYSVRCIQD